MAENFFDFEPDTIESVNPDAVAPGLREKARTSSVELSDPSEKLIEQYYATRTEIPDSKGQLRTKRGKFLPRVLNALYLSFIGLVWIVFIVYAAGVIMGVANVGQFLSTLNEGGVRETIDSMPSQPFSQFINQTQEFYDNRLVFLAEYVAAPFAAMIAGTVALVLAKAGIVALWKKYVTDRRG